MKKKVLLVATVQSHIAQFHKPLIDMLHKNGYEVDVAARNNLQEKNGLQIENADNIFEVCFSRSPFSKDNIKAYKQLKQIVKENNYEIIHCNTPMGGVIARVVAKKYRKNGMKVIYTVHGFHFYKGAPIKNWLIYYPIEKYLSRYTDCLITINNEDYELAKKKFKRTNVEYICGVGLNEKKFNFNMTVEEENKLKQELGIVHGDFVIIYVAEMTKNKNHYMAINAVKNMLENRSNIKLLLAGNGPLQNEYKKFIKENNLENNIKMLGYRLDVPKLMKISDIAISTSNREGLPVNVMEAMISGLPDIVTNCRGSRDLIKDGKNGYVINLNDANELQQKIEYLMDNKELREAMGKNGQAMIEPYKVENVIKKLEKIYFESLNNKTKGDFDEK